MSNHIFISWSGEKSKRIAEVFNNWIYINFTINTWFSVNDINSGEIWKFKILEALQDSSIGVFFLTKENINAPWINYEAGAISKGNAENGVCIVKVDFEDIPKKSPLFHYQNHALNKKGMYKIVSRIMNSEDLSKDDFDNKFEAAWDDFERACREIICGENWLINKNYIPRFRNIIPEEKYKEFSKADKSSLNDFFKREYEKIDVNSIGERLQFIIDRTVIFVYLNNNQCWGTYLNRLEDTNNEQNYSTNYEAYNISITILRQVFYYHRMMGEKNRSIKYGFEEIRAELLKVLEHLNENPDLITNKMVYCLLYDYLGLCSHKIAIKELAECINKSSFNILDPKDRNAIKSVKNNKRENIIKHINNAIGFFDKILVDTEYENRFGFRRMGEYIWDDFALYNKARCQYILHCFDIDQVKWKETMEKAVKARKNSVDLYSDMPFAIVSNLYAEYLHAQLEQFSYLNQKPNEDFESSYTEWIKLCYEDVLKVSEKYEKIKKLQFDK